MIQSVLQFLVMKMEEYVLKRMETQPVFVNMDGPQEIVPHAIVHSFVETMEGVSLQLEDAYATEDTMAPTVNILYVTRGEVMILKSVQAMEDALHQINAHVRK